MGADVAAETVDWLARGRAAYAERAWESARTALARADQGAPLGADDLELLATSAYMVGRVDEFLAVLERAHEAHLERGEPLRAVRCAFFIGVNFALLGEIGRASGWFGRAQRLVEREGDCVERGYLLMPGALQSAATGELDAAYAAAGAAAETAERFGDRDLFALAVHTQGQVLIKQGRVGEGLTLLDEAMLRVAADELSPIVTGVVYCGVIAGCEEVYELRRAREWTEALSRWCNAQPEMVAFGGRCLAHRAEIMLLHGAWQEALEESTRARERSERAMNQSAAGQALYQQGELHRLRGDFAAAERAYRDAHQSGREPQPGLALLRLAQGETEKAAAAIRRALAETVEPLKRARLLPACAEIMVAADDRQAAREACDELDAISKRYESAMLRALVDHVRGMVELADGDSRAALVPLARARQAWQELDAPYEGARTRVLIGLACRDLGDDDAAELQLEAARAVFAQVGAAPDLARIGRRARGPRGLTQRELEVLRLVAQGKSNRQIASALVVSEHTVARHVQNIFRKLRVSSRTAAAAFAFEHELV
jgi:DNA-binding CsgD family transcriptional regulator